MKKRLNYNNGETRRILNGRDQTINPIEIPTNQQLQKLTWETNFQTQTSLRYIK